MRVSIFLFLLFTLPACSGAFCRKDVEDIPNITLKPLYKGFDKPIFFLGKGGKFYVVEQEGRIKVIEGDKIKVFLDLTDRIENGGEKGLLGLAFHPKDPKRFYIHYTVRENSKLYSVISEVTLPEKSERVLLKIYQPFDNHNGGHLEFGPDGYLYIGFGDGGSANDPLNSGQRLDTLLGKILRIDVDKVSEGRNYGVPEDNPFVKVKGARGEIWAYGLRNPWRFSFDPVKGYLYVGDVGQNAREEINIVRKGGNYGWRVMEGSICTPGVKDPCDPSLYEKPIWEYGRKDGIAVIGGYVYRGTEFPELCGVYFFGDWGTGRIWGLIYDGRRVIKHKLLVDTDMMISSFGTDGAGNVYVVDHGGNIYRIGVK